MEHPSHLLPDHALGSLSAEEARALEAHLAGCAQCRAEVRRFEDIIAAVAAAPSTAEAIAHEIAPVPPPSAVWRGIAATVRPPRPSWLPWAAALALLLGGAGAGWGLDRHQRLLNVLAERTERAEESRDARRLLADYLARPDVRILPLRDPEGGVLGALLLLPLPRDEGLFVLADPPPAGAVFQVWGHKGEEIYVPLVTTRATVFTAPWEGFPGLTLGLEPDGGSARPTLILATVALR